MKYNKSQTAADAKFAFCIHTYGRRPHLRMGNRGFLYLVILKRVNQKKFDFLYNLCFWWILESCRSLWTREEERDCRLIANICFEELLFQRILRATRILEFSIISKCLNEARLELQSKISLRFLSRELCNFLMITLINGNDYSDILLNLKDK